MPPSRSVPWVRTSEKARSKHYDEQGSYFEVPCAPYSLGFPFGGATGGTTTDEGCTVAVATFWAAFSADEAEFAACFATSRIGPAVSPWIFSTVSRASLLALMPK